MPVDVYAKLVVRGGDAVPTVMIARELESRLAGARFATRNEDGSSADLVIAEVHVGAFATGVDEEMAAAVDGEHDSQPRTREAACVLADLATVVADRGDAFPPGAGVALDIAVRALDPSESAGYPVELDGQR